MITKLDRRQLREDLDPFEELSMKKDTDIGFFTKVLLKLITFFQEATLKQANTDFYYRLTKIHFKLYFGKSLIEEVMNNSREFKAAQHRHGCMVTSVLWSHSGSGLKQSTFRRAKSSFMKNLILEAPL